MALFPVLLKIEESQLGTVLRAIHRLPGIAHLDLMLDDVPPKRGRIPGTNGAVNGTSERAPASAKNDKRSSGGVRPRAQDIIITELMSGQKTSDHLRMAIEAYGFEGNGIYPTIASLVDKGAVMKVSKGIYDMTPIARAKLQEGAPPGLPPPDIKNTKPGKPPKGTGVAFVSRMIRELGGRASRQQLLEAAGQEPLPSELIAGAISYLQKTKMVKSPQAGVYELTAKGNKHFAQETQPQAQEE